MTEAIPRRARQFRMRNSVRPGTDETGCGLEVLSPQKQLEVPRLSVGESSRLTLHPHRVTPLIDSTRALSGLCDFCRANSI